MRYVTTPPDVFIDTSLVSPRNVMVTGASENLSVPSCPSVTTWAVYTTGAAFALPQIASTKANPAVISCFMNSSDLISLASPSRDSTIDRPGRHHFPPSLGTGKDRKHAVVDRSVVVIRDQPAHQRTQVGLIDEKLAMVGVQWIRGRVRALAVATVERRDRKTDARPGMVHPGTGRHKIRIGNDAAAEGAHVAPIDGKRIGRIERSAHVGTETGAAVGLIHRYGQLIQEVGTDAVTVGGDDLE